ncbi:DUF4180 domain-containing protein [Streptomyces sp. SID3343]|uniref:DUF4180 domain-containing protein n=1 Tax=Streptomyces sp. SID3343 TaxID=2690260 RepID=UPI00136E9DD9|nr:DUF4180 domain-containing protein [Streptomyces sp. SID3343]MYW06429.1 DUF4180 domain-containing protein [Streptomyces sp. SID3343]
MPDPADSLENRHGALVWLCVAEGARIRTVVDLDDIGEGGNRRAERGVLPVVRLGPDFFRLRTRAASLGDIEYTGASDAPTDRVREGNRGRRHVRFPDVPAAFIDRFAEEGGRS